MGKIPLRTIDETYESPLKIGGKAIVTRVIGEYSSNRREYTLAEFLRVGDSERQLGTWSLEDPLMINDVSNRSTEQLVMEIRAKAIQDRDILAIIKSML